MENDNDHKASFLEEGDDNFALCDIESMHYGVRYPCSFLS